MTEQTKQPSTKPRQVLIAAVALGVTALFSVITALGIGTQKDWIHHQSVKANTSAVASAVSSASKGAAKKSQDVSSAVASASSSAEKKYPTSGKKLDDSVDSAVRSSYIGTVFTVIVLGILAFGVFRGRHWSRWTVTGIYVLSLFTPLGIGPLNLVGAILGGGEPAAIRIPSLVAGLAMLVAVVMVNLRPSVEFFALSRPAPRPGTPQRRGLFSRPAGGPARGNQPQRAAGSVSLNKGRAAANNQSTKTDTAADRQRAKKRATTEAVARGAELARNRAKASKSRRTER